MNTWVWRKRKATSHKRDSTSRDVALQTAQLLLQEGVFLERTVVFRFMTLLQEACIEVTSSGGDAERASQSKYAFKLCIPLLRRRLSLVTGWVLDGG